MGEFGLGITLLSDAIWVGLLTGWGGFWKCDQKLAGEAEGRGPEGGGKSGAKGGLAGFVSTDSAPPAHTPLPPEFSASPQSRSPHPQFAPAPVVCAVMPARNEADMVPRSIRSLLQQEYAGSFHIVLVDDHSTDGTGAIAQQIAETMGKAEQLTVIQAAELPPGWTGKLWAMEQGDRYVQTLLPPPDYLLFTDADIEHDRHNLSQLVAKALQDELEMVSLMVLLRCDSFWEKLLIPAFVFFFQKLYPFPLVNNPNSRVAAAAGGCLLIRREALKRIGGLQILRQALIDDCSLAKAVKSTANDRQNSRNEPPAHPTAPLPTAHAPGIWLGLTQTTRSLRPYHSLGTIWNMVARTAYTQLNYSPLLLLGTLVGMALVYLVAPIAAFTGLLTANGWLSAAGWVGWALMTLAYLPTIRLYGLSLWWAATLPAIALLYTLMTVDSALRHWRGQGGAWKGRVYPAG